MVATPSSKRKRSSSGGSTSRRGSSSGGSRSRRGKASSLSGTSTFLSDLLEALRKLSRSDKSRITSLLQALLDSKFLLPNPPAQPSVQNRDTNLIIVTTHIVNRIVTSYTSKSDEKNHGAALLLSRLTYDLSQVLLSDKVKLERVANASLVPHARSVLGRTLISIVLGCLTSLEMFSEISVSTENESLVKAGLWETLMALETVTKFTKGGVNAASVTLHATGHQGAVSMETPGCPNSPYPNQIHNTPTEGESWWKLLAKKFVTSLDNDFSDHDWQEVAHTIFSDTEGEEEILDALLKECSSENSETSENASPTAPSKRKRTSPGKSKKEEKVDSTHATLSSALTNATELLYSEKYPANNVSIDGRLAMRRLASIMIVWFNGQIKILGSAIRILQNFHVWEKLLYLEIDSLEYFTHPKKKVTKSTKKASAIRSNANKPYLPGNVCVVAFVARLIDILAECGHVCGSRQPIGGMEAYTNIILGFQTKSTTSKSTLTVSKSSSPGESVAASLSRQLSLGNKNQQATRRTRSSARAAVSSFEKSSTSSTNMETSSIPKSSHLRIRDMSTAVMTLLLQAHQKCLIENFITPTAKTIQFSDEKISDLTTSDTVREFLLPNIHPFQKNLTRVYHIMLNIDSSIRLSPTGESRASDFALFFPLIHKTIDILARNTASFSVDNGVSGSCDVDSRLLGIGCSLSFKYGIAEHSINNDNEAASIFVVDSKLVSMAINQLSDCIGKMISYSKNISNDREDENEKDVKYETKETNQVNPSLIHEFGLDKGMVPDLTNVNIECGSDSNDYLGIFAISTANDEKLEIQSKKSSLGNEENSDHCIGNIENKQNSFESNGDSLALFLRALIEDSDRENDASETSKLTSSTNKLITKLLLLLQGCYTATEKQDISPFFVPRISYSCCTFASSILDVLRKCLTRISISTSTSHKVDPGNQISLQLLALLRPLGLSSDHICHFIHLGSVLDENLVQPRLNVSCNNVPESGDDDSQNGAKISCSNPDASHGNINEFDQWERNLWSSHIKVALTIGRGQPSFDSQSVLKHSFNNSFLGSRDDRLKIFQTVASKNHGTGFNGWPLCLSGIHHAIVCSSLTYDAPPPSSSDSYAELYILDQIFESLRGTLSNLSILEKNTKHIQGSKFLSFQISDEDIPLSLRDARLLLLALCRLPRKDQVKMLSKFISIIHDELEKIINSEGKKQLISQQTEMSGFLARLVTTCVTAVDMVIAGRALLDQLAFQIGPTHYHLPSLIEMTVCLDGTKANDCDWYKRESCFMGLFSDWESPAMPPTNTSEIIDPLSTHDSSKLESILENSLILGFSSAKIDRCHLLFSAWNASGKGVGWNKAKWNGPSTAKELSKFDYPKKLHTIREDICFIYRQFEKEDSQNPDTLLLRLMKKKKLGHRRDSGSLSDALKTAITTAVTFISSQIKGISEEKNEIPSLAQFAMLEGIASYISFITAMCTKSENDFLTTIIKNEKSLGSRRKNSSISADSIDDNVIDEDGNILSDDSAESDGGYPDFEEEEDEEKRIDCFSQLHNCCDLLGYAPFHPDWLDSGCHLRDGIPIGFSFHCAEKAVSSLTELALKAYVQYTKSLHDAIRVCLKEEVGPDQVSLDNNSLLPLVLLSTLPKNDKNNDCKAITSSVARLSKMNLIAFESIWKDTYKNETSPKEAWSINSANRIRGKLQEFSSAIESWDPLNCEYRATGEWELLLSDSLFGACIDSSQVCPTDGQSDSSPVSLTLESANMLSRYKAEANRWIRVVRSCANALVPATALLRFTLNGEKGRKHHPYTKKHGYSLCQSLAVPNSPLNLRSSSIYPSVNVTKSQLRQTVSKSLGLLSEISSNSLIDSDLRQTCRAAASHLVGESGVSDLEGLNTLRSTLMSLLGLSKSIHSLSACYDEGVLNMILDDLIGVIEKYKNTGTIDDDLISESQKLPKAARLLSCFGFPSFIFIHTLSDASVDPKQILLSSLPVSWSRLNEESALQFDWHSSQSNVVRGILTLLTTNKVTLKASVRCKIAELVRDLLLTEEECINNKEYSLSHSYVLKPHIMQFWSSLSPEQVKSLVKNDICLKSSLNHSESPKEDQMWKLSLSQSLCAIVSCITGSLGCTQNLGSKDEQNCKIVLGVLCEDIKEWVENQSCDHVVNLLCLLATRFNHLHQIGSMLMTLIISGQTETVKPNHCYLHVLENFYRFSLVLYSKLHGTKNEPTKRFLDSSLIPKPAGNILASFYKKTKKVMQPQKTKSGASFFFTKSGQKVLRTCSFVETGGDFVEQHWYNCYTCGLLWDKGCCSLCAQVCHKGHDVGYSRRSSFFCDCGAEVASAGDKKNRVSCKCLTALSANELTSIYDEKQITNSALENITDLESKRGCSNVTEQKNDAYDNVAVEISTRMFTAEALVALKHFVEEAKKSSWTEKLFKLFNSCFESWAERKSARKLLFTMNDSSNEDGIPDEDSAFSQDPLIRERSGRILELSFTKNPSLVPIRSAKSTSLNTKLSLDTTTDRLQKSTLAKNDIIRNILGADSRGRLIIAEPCSLIFCAALPLVNTRHVENHLNSSLDRSNLSILGSTKVNFNIVGLQICPCNDRYLVVWGVAEVSIFILNSSWDKVDARIDLVIELEPNDCETEYLLKCMWLPQSQNTIAVVCGTFVKIFDIRRSTATVGINENDYSCRSSSCFTLAYEDVVIRGAVFIPLNLNKSEENISNNGCDNDDLSSVVKLVLLFDSGRLHLRDLAINANGSLLDQGESYIECGDGTPFPTAGIRRYVGATPGSSTSTSSSFGESSCLHYLQHSNLLLYKCISSCLVALMVDESGKISGSFELLPHVLNSDILGNGSDGYSISGPYTHWTELGIVENDGSFFYRAVCVGKSTRTNQPKLLCVEFNRETVQIKELKWASGSGIGLGLSLNTSFEGIAAFSSPLLVGSQNGFFGKNCCFKERIFITALTSNGALLIFGEKIVDGKRQNDETCTEVSEVISPVKRRRALSDSIVSVCGKNQRSKPVSLEKAKRNHKISQPNFPLTIFETLINVSNSDDLVFGGEFAANEPESTKKKLSISNAEFLISPNKEGFCLTVALKNNEMSIDAKEGQEKLKKSKLCKENEDANCSDKKRAIVAIRLLIGSTTTDYLPQEVTVMGRPVKLAQGVKRWYDMPLTDEEIMLGIRSGFVCVTIGASFDTTNNPIIDAVEVYCKKREDLKFLSQCTLGINKKSTKSNAVSKNNSPSPISIEEEICRKTLSLSMLNVTHLSQIVGESIDRSQVNHTTLKRLVQVTALDYNGQSDVRENVLALLKEVESDINCRQVLIDEGTLHGVVDTLKDVRSSLNMVYELKNFSDGKMRERISLDRSISNRTQFYVEILTTLERCLEASLDICKQRPENYYDSIMKIMSSSSSDASIAVTVKEILDKCKFKGDKMIGTSSLLVELTIREMYIDFQNLEPKIPSVKFAGFELFADLLSSDYDVVECCCAKIAEVMGEVHEMISPNTQPIAYKCDICDTLPITGTRYTLEGDHDKDLCKICFEMGSVYAKMHKYDPNVPIRFNGKKLLLKDVEMSCSQIQQMKPVLVANAIIEQFAEVNIPTHDPSISVIDDLKSGVGDDDTTALQMALKMSLESPENDFCHGSTDETGQSRFYSVNQKIFNGLLKLATDSLSSNTTTLRHLSPVIRLLLKLILKSERDIQISRGKAMCEVFSQKLASLAEKCINNNNEIPNRKVRNSLITVLRALVSLVHREGFKMIDSECVNDAVAEIDDGDGENSSASDQKIKDKTDPRFVCGVHGVPAVRRRCSNGINKDRRFYVCGMGRKRRCKYFKWADSGTNKSAASHSKSPGSQMSPAELTVSDAPNTFSDQDFLIQDIREYLWDSFSNGDPPLQVQLCNLVKVAFKKLEDNSFKENSLKSQKTHRKMGKEKVLSTIPTLSKIINDKDITSDVQDGVFLSRERFGFLPKDNMQSRDDNSERIMNNVDTFPNLGSGDIPVVQAILDLLSIVASNSLRPMKNNILNWSPAWFSLLCEIISTSSSFYLRSQAKKMLKRLCGDRRAIYHRVRDHYVFGFQFRNLIQRCHGPLQAGLDVREKARRCGLDWRSSSLSWSTLPAGGFLGVEDLISEDSLTIENNGKVKKILDDLIEITKTRGSNWRQFMGMSHLPKVQDEDNFSMLISGTVSESKESVSPVSSDDIWTRSPICILLWIACCLSKSNQVKVFHLMNVSLTTDVDETHVQCDNAPIHQGTEESCGVTSTDAGTDFEGSNAKLIYQSFEEPLMNSEMKSPEASLLKTENGLIASDVYAFIIQFVLRGRTSELRSVASKIAQKLVITSSQTDDIVLKLVLASVREIGPHGCASIEFLKLIRSLVNEPILSKTMRYGALSKIVTSCFTEQILSHCNSASLVLGQDFATIENNSISTEKKQFDLASCIHCHRKKTGLRDGEKSDDPKAQSSSSPNNEPSTSSSKDTTSSTKSTGKRFTSSKSPPNSELPWLDDQIRPFNRNRLEISTENNVSTEFASHYQLKFRMAITDIHLTVNDPRGRFVKTIVVYFLPRPAFDVKDLISEDNAQLWQKCGTISLARGAARATCKLDIPVIAANLKFEFADFYERLGGAHSSDGTLLLHCPRCTRVVNNAHGVCGHCGEVAFQCRKCRHINYDRLDAFLCVECGYCASGGFSFELTAGLASKSVAIVDERGLDMMVQLLRNENRNLFETRKSLLSILSSCNSRKKRPRLIEVDETECLDKYSSSLKRALLGDLPKSVGTHDNENILANKKRSSGVSKSSSPSRSESTFRPSAANKARSLLSLARQLRNESSGGNNDRGGRNDVLVRQALLNASGTFEFFDEAEGDMFGIINSSEGNVFQMDVPDPLSRLVANIHARVRSGTSSAGNFGMDNSDDTRGANNVDNSIVGEDNLGSRSRKKNSNSRTRLDEAEKLFKQMREAERETFELNKRIMAWKRLNRDALADIELFIPNFTSQFSYSPTLCSACSGTITFHLLALAMELFRLNMKESEVALSGDFIKALFEEPRGMSYHLHDLKRLVITSLAVKSKRGSKLIYNELKSRLQSKHDVACAEILGKILENDFHMADDYVRLAVEVLKFG